MCAGVANQRSYIEKRKDRYRDALEGADAGRHEELNNHIPLIRYMLQVILYCCAEFENRARGMAAAGVIDAR